MMYKRCADTFMIIFFQAPGYTRKFFRGKFIKIFNIKANFILICIAKQNRYIPGKVKLIEFRFELFGAILELWCIGGKFSGHQYTKSPKITKRSYILLINNKIK